MPKLFANQQVCGRVSETVELDKRALIILETEHRKYNSFGFVDIH